MRTAPKIDGNQLEIVNRARKLGWEVYSLAACGKGFPDLLISNESDMWLLEVKDGDTAKLTKDQLDFFNRWKGKPILVIRSVSELLDFDRRIRKGEDYGKYTRIRHRNSKKADTGIF